MSSAKLEGIRAVTGQFSNPYSSDTPEYDEWNRGFEFKLLQRRLAQEYWDARRKRENELESEKTGVGPR